MNLWLILPLLIPLLTAVIALLAYRSRLVQRRVSDRPAALLAAAIGLLIDVARNGVQAVQIGNWPAPYGITVSPLEGTYLAWLDCRAIGIEQPYDFFLHEARVALNDGATFGPGGKGFVRLNLGCSRSVLLEALERMRAALPA